MIGSHGGLLHMIPLGNAVPYQTKRIVKEYVHAANVVVPQPYANQ
jgi:hypothetical protein